MLKIKLVDPHQLNQFKLPISQIDQALSEPNQPPVKLYYVHYIDYNKRLDEWVTIDRMRLDKIQAPVSSSSSSGASSAAALASFHSAQSHLCNISNSNLKELTSSGTGLKHDLSGGEEHGMMPPKKKKTAGNKQMPVIAVHNLHGSVSVPVNLAASSGRIATNSESSSVTIEQTPSTPSSTLNETQDALTR